MSFTFRPATRESAKLLIGLCGPSGSGKTLSALRLATGIGGQIAYIDTEQGRALQYAGDFKFMHAVLPPPFHPNNYREIIDDAVKLNPSVVIVDSISHVWEGPGGVLDMVDQARGNGNDFSIWAKPKQAHQKLVNRLIQIPAHVIICFRAKEKRGLVKNDRGKTEVVDLGWQPIAEGGLVYELTVNCLLSAEKKGTPIIDGFDAGKLPYNMAALLPPGEQIGEATGKRFAEWCHAAPSAPSAVGQVDMPIEPPADDPLRINGLGIKSAVETLDMRLSDTSIPAGQRAAWWWAYKDRLAGKLKPETIAKFEEMVMPQGEDA